MELASLFRSGKLYSRWAADRREIRQLLEIHLNRTLRQVVGTLGDLLMTNDA